MTDGKNFKQDESNDQDRLGSGFTWNPVHLVNPVEICCDLLVVERCRRIEENTLESLQEAVQLSPTNGLAFAQLARKVLEQVDNPRRVGEAVFYSRRAVELSPNDAEVLRIRDEIKAKTKN